MAPFLRVRPELQKVCQLGAQWASEHASEEGDWAPFHIVTHGACLLDLEGRDGIPLNEGDVAVIRDGQPHCLRSFPSEAATPPLRVHRRQHDELVVVTNVSGESETKLVCGRFQFECAHGSTVLAGLLPAVIIVRAAEGRDASHIQSLVNIIRTELEEDGPESIVISTGLASALMTMVLRARLKSGLEGQGVLALLACPQTAKAIEVMLKGLDRTWTLEELARYANTSKATLVRLFNRAVDTSPLAFLSELRLIVARDRILATNTPLVVIGELVGYQSETAFNRAYRRRFGVCPGEMRRKAALSSSALRKGPPLGDRVRAADGRGYAAPRHDDARP